MSAPRVGPCSTWPYSPCGDLEPEDEELVASAATHILWALSGRRFGLCDMVLRPCARREWDGWWMQYVYTSPTTFNSLANLAWSSWPVCGCSSFRVSPGNWWDFSTHDCSCGSLPSFRLPGPIASLTQVRNDGVDLVLPGTPGAQLRVDGWRQVSRTDGGLLTTCQDRRVEDGPGSLIVRYQKGRPVPDLGILAMGELVSELARSCAGESCALPSRVREITRKGIQTVVIDPRDFLDKGRTGLPKVDLFLQAVNPKNLQRRARIFRADSLRMPRLGT